MRKVLKVTTALVLSLVMIFSMSILAMAAGSKTDVVEIEATDKNGEKTDYTTEEVPEDVWLTKPVAAAAIGDGCTEDEIEILWQQDLKAETPATFTFTAPEQSEDQSLYLFHYEGSWVIVESAKGTSITHTFDSLSPVALVLRKTAKSAGSQGQAGQSDTTTSTGSVPTGDNTSIALWGALMVVAAVGATGTIVYSRKRRTNE